MLYEVSGVRQNIDWEATGVDDILQNISYILTTVMGTVPYRLGWFIDPAIIDMQQALAQQKIIRDVFTAIREHEPRAIYRDIRFVQTVSERIDGYLMPVVTVEIPDV